MRSVIVALIAIIALRVPASATIFPANQDACYLADLSAALDKIRRADSLLAQMLDTLEKSKTIYIVFNSNTITSHDTSNGQWIEWNPAYTGQYPGEGMCVDAVAGLVHELWHKYEIETKSVDRTADVSSNGIRRSEISAIHMENVYRGGVGLCNRWRYGSKPLPSSDLPITHCPTLAAGAACPPPITGCARYCCWVYNMDGKGGACTKDNLTAGECDTLNVPFKVNAGTYRSPCSTTFPSTPKCK
jgi:hypothetical protein